MSTLPCSHVNTFASGFSDDTMASRPSTTFFSNISTLFNTMKSAHSTCSTSRSTTGRMPPPSPSSGRAATGAFEE